MKKNILAFAILIILFTGCSQAEQQNNINKNNMKITSSFGENQQIPSKYTCDGSDINPPLSISDVPENAISLALILEDPDAPAGTWVHWVVWNIDPKTAEINENSVPNGSIQGVTSFGDNKYGGPCPPSGTHRYLFKLYALDERLALASSADKSKLEASMKGHTISETKLTGLYKH